MEALRLAEKRRKYSANRDTSSLLINEAPIQVLPSLAVKIGLYEAMILQQVHYWTLRSEHVREGKPWVWNTYEDWEIQFPFLSKRTIQRTILGLEKPLLAEDGTEIRPALLISRTDFNTHPLDRTKWYRIDYEKLRDVEEQEGQNVPIYDAPNGYDVVPTGHHGNANGAPCEGANLARYTETPETTYREVPPNPQRGKSRGATPEEAAAFETFWKAYPKRDRNADKVGARAKFLAHLRNGVSPDLILAGANRFRALEESKGYIGTNYVPMTTTWLNQRGWEDEYTEAPANGASGPDPNEMISTPIGRMKRSSYEAFQRQEARRQEREQQPGYRP